jgi:uncharacterized phage protein gp47/JayE
VAAEIKSLFRRQATVSLPEEQFTLYRSKIEQAISNATGEDHNELVAPSTDIEFAVGTMPCLRSVTFLPQGS